MVFKRCPGARYRYRVCSQPSFPDPRYGAGTPRASSRPSSTRNHAGYLVIVQEAHLALLGYAFPPPVSLK